MGRIHTFDNCKHYARGGSNPFKWQLRANSSHYSRSYQSSFTDLTSFENLLASLTASLRWLQKGYSSNWIRVQLILPTRCFPTSHVQTYQMEPGQGNLEDHPKLLQNNGQKMAAGLLLHKQAVN